MEINGYEFNIQKKNFKKCQICKREMPKDRIYQHLKWEHNIK